MLFLLALRKIEILSSRQKTHQVFKSDFSNQGMIIMKSYGIAVQIFLLLALIGWIGWLVTRFSGPVIKISYQGFNVFSTNCLLFAIAISLIKLAFADKKD
jgi:hypothetical protein